MVAAADDGFSDTMFDCGRLVQSLLLAAAAEGLRGCPATVFPDSNVKRAAELLGLEVGWLPRHLVALGHPVPRPPARGRSAVPSGRKELSQIYRDQQ
ncbi:nitroreductase family protein [Mycobacterium sp. 852013-50091_SCH5140682]|uniref:nitroreductase family protein n=1 Tax=Mycobacterium sp. 852013-50091_SCH5140682 TaxID=1834109 RepID=UPI000A4A2B70|nr:nitroreductase family protein [Mycobacterium sp. 852013-50091_SCH5140682]